MDSGRVEAAFLCGDRTKNPWVDVVVPSCVIEAVGCGGDRREKRQRQGGAGASGKIELAFAVVEHPLLALREVLTS